MVTKSIPVIIGFILLIYSTSAQSTSSKKICEQYPAIEDNFTADKENYHYYNVETLICSTDEFKNANKDVIYSILLSHANYVAPTYNTAAVSNCSKVILNIGAITIDTKYFFDDAYLNDPIVTVIDKSKYSVTNYTLPEHRLHAGKVIRSIIQRGNEFYITSRGRGNNVSKIYGEINDNLAAMDLLWHQVDKSFVEAVRKELYNKNPDSEKNPTPMSSFYGHWQGFVKFGAWAFKQEMNFEFSKGSNPNEVNVVASHLRLTEFAKNTVTGKYENGILTIQFFTPKLSMNSACEGKMVFKLLDNTNIKGKFVTGNTECDTASYLGIRKDRSDLDTTFKIDTKYVTLSSDKKFRWYNWEQAPKDFKNAARFLKINNNQSLLSLVDDCYKYADHEVQIAAVDLDGDGICGLAVFLQSLALCGTAGCTFELYDNGGLTTVDLGTDHEVKPSKNGVIASTGRFFPLQRNVRVSIDEKETLQLFTYDKKKEVLPNKTLGILTGGTTPDELGKTLLKALQTNNKQLWTSCIHPESPNKFGLAELFDSYRKELNEGGLSQWNLVKYSRVTFTTDDYMGIKVESEYKGEKVARYFRVEFSYNNKEFIGNFTFSSVLTYKRERYFIYNTLPYRAGLNRYDTRK